MRYTLRALLILVTIVSAILARVAYLKQMAHFHRERAIAIATSLSTDSHDSDNIITMARILASRGTALTQNTPRETKQSPGIFLDNGLGWTVIAKNKEMADAWCEAVRHEVIANRFDRASYRPWVIVSEVVKAEPSITSQGHP
jgi:hypothetical protein